MKVQIESARCQGHGRCYYLAPAVFDDDLEGYGTVTGDGIVPPDQEQEARVATDSCPERAISLIEGA